MTNRKRYLIAIIIIILFILFSIYSYKAYYNIIMKRAVPIGLQHKVLNWFNIIYMAGYQFVSLWNGRVKKILKVTARCGMEHDEKWMRRYL